MTQTKLNPTLADVIPRRDCRVCFVSRRTRTKIADDAMGKMGGGGRAAAGKNDVMTEILPRRNSFIMLVEHKTGVADRRVNRDKSEQRQTTTNCVYYWSELLHFRERSLEACKFSLITAPTEWNTVLDLLVERTDIRSLLKVTTWHAFRWKKSK